MNKTTTLTLLAAFATVLPSCTSGPDLTRVSMGMDKSQVFHQLGRPLTVNARGSTEELVYGWTDSMWDGRVGERHWYVQLADNRVVAYGAVPLTESQIVANGMEKAAAIGAIRSASASIGQDNRQAAQHAHERLLESDRSLNRSIERMTPQRIDVRIR